jgi:hypothetical protein
MANEPGSGSKTKTVLLLAAGILLGALIPVAVLFISARRPTPPTTNTPQPWPTVVTATPTQTPAPTLTATSMPTATPTPVPTSTSTPTPTPTPTPIIVPMQVRALGRLVTFEYKLQTISEVRRDSWLGLFGSDRVVLIAVVKVQAGVDLAKMADEDVIVQGQKATIYLPAAEIFTTELVEKESSVYARDRKWLFSDQQDKQVELEAAALAEQQAQVWTSENGILDHAQTEASYRMEALLRRLGFTEVTINFREQKETH